MSKHYNLTVTDDNGKSVTTSNTSTEHPEEVLRMMHLAGMQSQSDCGCDPSPCGCGESIEEETEYKPTPANDKLDLDDYSKKSPESIAKQKKSLDKAPSRGDNPLEYSLDESEIYESLMDDFIEDEIKETTEEKVEEGISTPNTLEKVEAQIKKLEAMADEALKNDDPHRAEMIQRSDEMTALLRKRHKLKKDESISEVEEETSEEPQKFIAEEKCRYCGGDCPDDPNHACDGFIGDIDNLYGSYDEEGEDEMDENAELNRLRKLANLPQETEQPTEEVTQEEVVAEEEDMYAWFNAKTGDHGYGKKAEMSNWTHYMPASDFTYFSGNDDYKGYDEEVAKQEGWIAVGAEESEQVDEIVPIPTIVGMAAKKIGGSMLKKAVKTGVKSAINQVSNATNNQQ